MPYHQLTREERYFISTRMRSGASLRAIAQEMGRSASTISREVARNATRHDGAYRPSKAQRYAQARRRRCRRRSRFTAEQLAWIDTLLWMKWSPEQIAGLLALTGELSISHEMIYRRIRHDKRRGGHLWLYTRIMSKFARKRYRGRSTRGILAGKRHISERPKEVESRRRFGHRSLLTIALHQSATRHRQAGRLSLRAASARLCVVASYSTGSPQSWLAPPLTGGSYRWPHQRNAAQ